MSLSLATFLKRHPEFVKTNTATPDLVSEAIADANAEIDDQTWGDKATRGQALHAATTLARSPSGLRAALIDKTGAAVYEEELDRLRMLVGRANRPVMP